MAKSAGKLTDKEIVEARIAILKPLTEIASRHGFEKSSILEQAEKHWEFAIKPIVDAKEAQPEKPPAA